MLADILTENRLILPGFHRVIGGIFETLIGKNLVTAMSEGTMIMLIFSEGLLLGKKRMLTC